MAGASPPSPSATLHAGTDHDGGTDAPCSEAFVVSVKNTFLHVGLADAPPRAHQRRALSLPCDLRLLGVAASAPAAGLKAAGDDAAAGAGGEGPCGRWSEPSTSAGSPGGASRTSLLSMDPEADSKSVTSAMSAEARSAAPLLRAARAPAAPAAAPDTLHRTPLNAKARPWRREEALAKPAVLGAGRPPLVAPTQGQLTPCRALPIGARAAPAPADLLRQLTAVVAAAAAALAGCACIRLSGSSEGTRGWSIVAAIRAEEVSTRERLLVLAKDALLEAAGRSGNRVHVLGHKAQPFVSTPVGFAATLGAIQDESKACWSVIHDGFCRRGAACRWQHPACQTNVNVIVKAEKAL